MIRREFGFCFKAYFDCSVVMYLIDEYLARVDKVQQRLEDVRRDGVQRHALLLALDGQLWTEHGFEVG